MQDNRIYDTLIIGSGYFSVGYALSEGSCIICEENQICDTHFYLPLRSFRYKEYLPKTDEGKRLFEIFSELSLFSGDMQNTNAFECGFCKFLLEYQTDILLKCRVIKIEDTNGAHRITVQTNEGLSHLYAKRILNTMGGEDRCFTTLFNTDDERDCQALCEAFPDSYIERAFYPERYALYIPTGGRDENSIKVDIYEKWKSLGLGARIVYMAPTFSRTAEGDLCDSAYKNPIEAFEAGYFYAKGERK